MRIRLNGLVVGALLALGCSTPSVPIPPPDVDVAALSFSQPSSPTGQLVLTGKPSAYHDGAQFFITDRGTGDGVIVTAAANGSFTTPAFAAAAGDIVKIQYTTPALVVSVPVCVTIVVGGPLDGERCE